MVQQMIKRARALYPGMVTLRSDVLPRRDARREDEARWAALGAAEASSDADGGADPGTDQGWDAIGHGLGGGRLLPEGDPDAPWNVGLAQEPSDTVKIPYDIASLDAARPDQRIEQEIGELMRGRLADGVTYHQWPVPGDGKLAKSGAIGPNGNKYSDGSYAPNGGTRGWDNKKGQPISHMGADFPAKIGTNVASVDDGVVIGVGTQWSRKNPKLKAGWGDYVDVRYRDGTIGKYAHLKPEGRPVVGAHMKQGETVGVVGNTGNAATKGDHVHYEMRLPDGRTIDPTPWIRQRRPVYVYPSD